MIPLYTIRLTQQQIETLLTEIKTQLDQPCVNNSKHYDLLCVQNILEDALDNGG